MAHTRHMERSAHSLSRGAFGLAICFSLISACADDAPPAASASETSTATGDGDGDPATASNTTPGDGDGDSGTGDGDGDSSTGDGDGDSGTGTGDGDGDSSTGDGDGDSSTSGDSDSDSGDGDGDTGTTSGDGDGDSGSDSDSDTQTGDGDGDFGETGFAEEETGFAEEETGFGETGFAEEETGGFINFIPDDDFGMPNECDPWFQDCLEGEKCVAYASGGGTWDANKCVPILGDAQQGDVCTYAGAVEATDDCDAGLMCWNVDDNQQGTCTELCTGSPQDPICDPGMSCIISNSGSLTLCLEDCDPLAQDCAEELGCYWSGMGFQCVFRTEDLPTGAACGFLNDCAPGNFCTGAESLPNCNGGSCCANFCDLDNGNLDCAGVPGTECVPFFEEGEATPGNEDVGVCIIPQ